MAPLKGGHSSDELSISPGPTGATPAERSGQIHRCRMTSCTAVGVSRTVLPAGREGPGVPVDVQPHSRQDPETLAERERHAVPPSEHRWMRQRPFRIPPFGVPIRRPTPEPARCAGARPMRRRRAGRRPFAAVASAVVSAAAFAVVFAGPARPRGRAPVVGTLSSQPSSPVPSGVCRLSSRPSSRRRTGRPSPAGRPGSRPALRRSRPRGSMRRTVPPPSPTNVHERPRTLRARARRSRAGHDHPAPMY